MKCLVFVGAVLLLTEVSAFGDFDLRDALPGHITDDQTTTKKPVQVQSTG